MKHNDVCEVTCVDEEKVKRVKGTVSQQNTMGEAIENSNKKTVYRVQGFT